MFMTDDDIKNLTGYKRSSCQTKWLREHGIICMVGYDGKPKVLRTHCEEVLGLKTKSYQRRREPNFDALKTSVGLAQ